MNIPKMSIVMIFRVFLQIILENISVSVFLGSALTLTLPLHFYKISKISVRYPRIEEYFKKCIMSIFSDHGGSTEYDKI